MKKKKKTKFHDKVLFENGLINDQNLKNYNDDDDDCVCSPFAKRFKHFRTSSTYIGGIKGPIYTLKK